MRCHEYNTMLLRPFGSEGISSKEEHRRDLLLPHRDSTLGISGQTSYQNGSNQEMHVPCDYKESVKVIKHILYGYIYFHQMYNSPPRILIVGKLLDGDTGP